MGAALGYSPARVFARPTADAIWLGPAQESARGRLLRGPQARLLVGPSSSGKSTLLAHVAAMLGGESMVLVARGAHGTAAALLTALLQSAGLHVWDLSDSELRNLLTVLVQQRRSQHRRVIVLIDDAHGLGAEAWEETERLCAWRIQGRPALELVLAGGPLLAERRARAWLEERPREVALEELRLPTTAEMTGYIEWRLAQFDLTGIITPVATQLIARSSGGRFGAVDVLCQMALLLLRRHGLDRVDVRLVRQALTAFAVRRQALADAVEAAPAAPVPLQREAPGGYLLVSREGKLLQRVALAPRLLLGRSRHNDVCLQSPYLGRHHAAIVGTPEGYYVVDLNSANGLAVNGQRTLRAILSDQDVLSMGPFRLKLQLPERIAQGSPLPDAESLADTAVMPGGAEPTVSLTRIK